MDELRGAPLPYIQASIRARAVNVPLASSRSQQNAAATTPHFRAGYMLVFSETSA